jgi:hypothetical protein
MHTRNVIIAGSLMLGLLCPVNLSDILFHLRWQVYLVDNARMKLSLRSMKIGDSVRSIADDPTEGLSSTQIVHLFGKPSHIERFKWKTTQGPHGLEMSKIYLLPNEKDSDGGCSGEGEDWLYHNLRMSVTLTRVGNCLVTDFTEVF